MAPVERRQEHTDAPHVRHTEHGAQANLLALLGLCAVDKLRCSEKTRRPAVSPDRLPVFRKATITLGCPLA